MAEQPRYQRTTRTRLSSSVAAIEDTVAQLIAQDMRELDKQDNADTPEADSSKYLTAATIQLSRSMKDNSDDKQDNSDASEGATSQHLGAATTQLTGGIKGQSEENEGEGDIQRDRLESQADTGARPRTVGAETIQVTGAMESYSEGNERRGHTWRDRLESQEDTGARPRRVEAENAEYCQESGAEFKRRESGGVNETKEVAAISTKDWLDRHEYKRNPTRRSWRDRIGMDDSSSRENTTEDRDGARRNEESSASSRTSSWRERLKSDYEDFANKTEQNEETEERPRYVRGSWRERYGFKRSDTSADSVRDILEDNQESHDAGARPRMQRSLSYDYTPTTASRPWRERMRVNAGGTDSIDERDTEERSQNVRDTASRPWRQRLSLAEESRSMREPGNERKNGEEDSPPRHSWRDRVGLQEGRRVSEPLPLRNRITARDHTDGASVSDNSEDASIERAILRGLDPERRVSEDVAVTDRNPVEAVRQRSDVDLRSRDDHDANEGEMVTTRQSAEQGEDESGDTGTEKPEKTWTTEDVLKLLIKAINFRSPLKDIETVLRWELDVNTPYQSGLCALHYAAYTNYVKCVDILLQHGANINVTDDIGYTPLHLAARCGHYKTMEKLIENGAMVTFNEPGTEIRGVDKQNKLGFTNTEPINLAIQNSHAECAELLLQNGARPDNKYFMGYEISLAPLDNPRCLEVLLQYGASPNVFNRSGLSPLMKACKGHYIEAVKLLLKHGADHNAQCPPLFEQKSVLQIAIESGNIVIINLILAKNPKISRNDNYKYSALHTAILKGRSDICRLLLQRGADARERTDEQATALMLACSTEGIRERKEIVKMLLDCGADVNAYGQSFSYLDPYLAPITEYFKHVGSNESFNIIDILISHGARIHFTSGDPLLGGRRDPYAILPYIHNMENFPDIFDLTMQVAQRYNPLAIHVCESVPDEMKNILLIVATKPQDLKHLVRLAIRHMLMPNILEKVKQLPIPELMKSYLTLK